MNRQGEAWVARLMCGHDVGGEANAPHPGDEWMCVKVGCGLSQRIVDVVLAGPEPDAKGRRW